MRTIVFGSALLALTACAGAKGATESGGASQTGADALPAKWCQATPGSTKEELVAVMGPPAGTSGETMTWAADHYRFYAFLDASGHVDQLDTNTSALSESEKAALKCDTIRTRASAARAAAKKPARASRKSPAACSLVTDAEMSTILGAAMMAEPNDRSSGKTECNYSPRSGASPAVKLSVDWGDGEVAMKAAGFMGKHEPGLANPYEGLGDQAVAVGPALMIRAGDDLVTIVFTGVSAAPAKARRIFDTARGRM